MDKLKQRFRENDRPFEICNQFLSLVREDLRAGLTPFELQDHVDEVRSHLEASSAAYESMGLDPIEAMHAAIKSLGNDPEVNRELIAQSRKNDHPVWQTPLLGTLSGVFSCYFLDSICMTIKLGRFYVTTVPFLMFFGSIAGLIVGCTLRSRSWSYSAAAARGVLASLFAGLVWFAIVLIKLHKWPGFAHNSLILLAYWPAVCSFTAVLTQVFNTAFGKLVKKRIPTSSSL